MTPDGYSFRLAGPLVLVGGPARHPPAFPIAGLVTRYRFVLGLEAAPTSACGVARASRAGAVGGARACVAPTAKPWPLRTQHWTGAGCAKVYGETASGARSDRPQLAKVLRLLKEGDTLIVARLDRLARSTRDLLNTLHAVGKKGAGFKSLADAWADTTTPHGRLMLTVLGGLAEFERELIRARTGEGRARAKAKGIHTGRPSKLNQHQRQEAIERLERGDTLMDIARTYGVSHTTILRLRPFAAAVAVGGPAGLEAQEGQR
jgi:DNA invertase Pin-like site-specific DNA recombinase